MTRVARKVVIIMDGNRLGQELWPVRFLKLCLFKAGLGRVVNHVKIGGKGYAVTPGDCPSYPYSVYDRFDYLAVLAKQSIVVASEPCPALSWFHPLHTSPGVIVCAIRETN
jgi:hypothetical protein